MNAADAAPETAHPGPPRPPQGDVPVDAVPRIIEALTGRTAPPDLLNAVKRLAYIRAGRRVVRLNDLRAMADQRNG